MQNASGGNKLIDVKKVILSKNPKLLKYLPSFVISYIKKILHEEEINSLLIEQQNVCGIQAVYNILKHFNVRLRFYGLENLANQDKIVVASNHPLGGLDGLALMLAVGQEKPEIVFPVNDILMNLKLLEDIFIPINKLGRNPKESLKLLDDVFASKKTVLYFPAGLVSRKIKGKIIDLDWKKTFVTKARQHKRNIIPTFINGFNSNFFYNLANLRKRLGIKANIEMFFLVNEMYKQRNKHIDIYFGSPIVVHNLKGQKKDDEIAKDIKAIVYQLSMQDFSSVTPKIIDFSKTSN